MNTFLQIESVTSPERLFGAAPDADLIKRTFRTLSRAVHPDFNGGSRKATDAFAKLAALYAEAERRLAAGIYGTAQATPAAPSGPVIIERKGRRYVVTGTLSGGDKCDLHRVSFEDGSKAKEGVLKIARNPDDDDLVASEIATLKAMWPPATSDGKGIRYTSRIKDSFRLPDPGRTPRQVIVLKYIADAYTLEEVRAAYPAGLCLEDAVWIFNRMTEGLGYAHRAGFIHGAVLPCHVMVRPEDHAGKLIDWGYAVPPGGKVSAISSPWRGLYAPEILAKRVATPSTDVYMAARCIQWLLGGKGDIVPTPRADRTGKQRAAEQFASFLRTCLVESPRSRVDDAWAVRKSVEDFMLRLYGPKEFHAMPMPAKA